MSAADEPGPLTEIRYSSCSLKDKHALAVLVAAHPVVKENAKGFQKAGLWHVYDPNSGEAFYVVSDGAWVSCCTVTNVSFEGRARILTECQSSITALGESQFRAAVVRALGATVHLLQ